MSVNHSTSVLSVTELTHSIKKHLEPSFSHIQVKGEVVNLKKQASGHLYFTLKDANSQISAVLFKGNVRFIKKLPQSGDEVILKGEINIYSPRGTYQIIVRDLQFSGVGALLLLLHERKEKLKHLGWFDQKCKKPLPPFPKVIGVVTSATGSVIQDILNVLKRRYPSFHLILNPVRVQGTQASQEIACAIKTFNQYQMADVLIIGRGGGSLEDLWPFNEECVALAIFESKIPIISAVGHETDVSISDLVADIRAPTPSAAAEIAVKELSGQIEFLTITHKRLSHILSQMIKQCRFQLQSIKRHPLIDSPYTLLGEYLQKTDDIHQSIIHKMEAIHRQKKLELFALKKQLEAIKPQSQITTFREKLVQMDQAIYTKVSYIIKTYKQTISHTTSEINRSAISQLHFKKKRFDPLSLNNQREKGVLEVINKKKCALKNIISHLHSLHPKNLLKRGYCIPFAEKDNSVIMHSQNLAVGEKISLLFHDGKVLTQIDDIQPNT